MYFFIVFFLSILSWGFPLLMVAVALAFKYSTVESYDGQVLTHVQIVHAASTMAKKTATSSSSHSSGQQSRHNISSVSYAERHCWLMEGPAYLWGFLIPGSILLLLGLWLAFQGSEAVKLAASLQVDSRTRNKLLKRRGLQIGLFIKLLILLAFVLVLGAMASLWALPELWAIYSVIQGAQVSLGNKLNNSSVYAGGAAHFFESISISTPWVVTYTSFFFVSRWPSAWATKRHRREYWPHSLWHAIVGCWNFTQSHDTSSNNTSRSTC